MPFSRSHAIVVFCLTLLVVGSAAAQFSPTVYEDDHLRVRAGIVEAGSRTLHIGDAMTLEIEVSFDASTVRVEELSDEFLQQAFASTPAIRLYQSGVAVSRADSENRAHVSRRWQLQVLDCAADMTNCPGSLSFDLPSLALSYRLIGADGDPSVDTRAARFRPWPGAIDLASAFPIGTLPIKTLQDVMPGGAFATPLNIDDSSSASSLLFAVAAALLAVGVFATLQNQQTSPARVPARAPATRWEQAFRSLDDANIPDDEWSDRLRRCFTWYCLDELGRNPYTMLGSSAASPGNSAAMESRHRDFFLDVLGRTEIGEEHRSAYRDKLSELTGQSDAIPMGTQTA